MRNFITFLAFSAISLIMNAQTTELDISGHHLSIRRVNGNPVLLVTSKETGAAQLLKVAPGTISINNLKALGQQQVEVTYTDSRGATQNIAFLYRDGEWIRSIMTLDRRELLPLCIIYH